MIVYVREEGDSMGINRWQGGIECHKRNEADAKARDTEEETPKDKKGGIPPLAWRPLRNRRRTQRNDELLTSLKSENNRTSHQGSQATCYIGPFLS
jgi:hypothetical protein